MEFPYIAASVGAVLIILQQLLMMNTGTHRAKHSIGVGIGDDRELERKVRRHGNLAENAAIFLLVLSFADMLSGGGMVVAVIGVVFLVARLSHALAFSSQAGSHGIEGEGQLFVVCRVVGALGTGLSGIILGLYLIYLLVA